ncbi:MAG: HPP family protein [Gammaproteobacteria bacterium]|nr:HPP family protein [Gammaproteobacteria bacterium]
MSRSLLHWKYWVERLRGGANAPPRISVRQTFLAGLGGMLAISALTLLTSSAGVPVLMAPFGASCFLVFAVPESPFAQPRNVIGGHLVSTAVGLLLLTFAGTEGWVMGLAVGLSITAMLLTRTGHPPAGADPLVVLLAQPGWTFLATPVLLGAGVVVGVALLFNNLRAGPGYPRYWRG